MPEEEFWGKLQAHSGQVVTLPLAAHLADVGAVFLELAGLPAYSQCLGKALGRPPTDSDLGRLACLATLHDLGKITPGFQNKATGARPNHGHIAPIPGLLCEANMRRLFECLPWLHAWDEKEGFTTFRLLVASFSHHGTPISLNEDLLKADLWTKDSQAGGWRFLRNLGARLPSWFPAAFAGEASVLPDSPVLEHLFAGMVMLADWIGSDTRFFPIARDRSGPTEFGFSEQQAAAAACALGLQTNSRRAAMRTPPEFVVQFGFPANALQVAVDRIPLQQGGGLGIIEAETGVGKTEAALRYFTRLWAEGLVDGIYFANPLRFAATQLFDRVVEFTRRTFGSDPPPTVLAVPGYLRVDDAAGFHLPDFAVHWSDDPSEAEAERRWACEHPKRFLAAPVAVGTIDQALLAGLRTPHAHLRAAALSRSLLVIDEVHASDPYMTELALGILDLFRRVGGQVLLLSATLGGETRAKYLKAMGHSGSMPDLNECISTPYPLISGPGFVTAVENRENDDKAKLPIRCRLLGVQGDPQGLAAVVAAQADKGGRILILRNSVNAVRETQQAIEAVLPHQVLFAVNGISCPHHSRYARADRELLDRQVENWFGKHGKAESGVLVSSQTIEQSLDVDFDLLVTDLCPMDVLLQRLGRLHRHRGRDALRPPSRRKPVCLVLTPEAMDAAGMRGRMAKRHSYGKDRAYPNLPALMATWEILAGMDRREEPLRIPEMSRSLVERALHSQALENVAQRFGMQGDLNDVLGAAGAQATQGRYAILRWDQPLSEQSWKREEPNPKTRLGSADLMVEFPEPFESPFGVAVDQLVLPEFLLPRGGYDAPPKVLSRDPQMTVFRLGDTTYSYTRFGLHKEEDH
jgi:CRISPR-associated endonuclease/helicase Cas3